MGASHRKKNEILCSEKCILVDSGDGFAMDNRESKKPQGLMGHPDPPDPSPVSATDLQHDGNRRKNTVSCVTSCMKMLLVLRQLGTVFRRDI